MKFLLGGGIAAAVIALIALIIAIISADGKVDYCYIDSVQGMRTGPVYVVVGHRPWRANADMAVEKTSEDAQRRMKELCPEK